MFIFCINEKGILKIRECVAIHKRRRYLFTVRTQHIRKQSCENGHTNHLFHWIPPQYLLNLSFRHLLNKSKSCIITLYLLKIYNFNKMLSGFTLK